MENTIKLTIDADAPGRSLLMLGNEAIARGALEAGVQLVASYPGTPSSEINETLSQFAKSRDFYLEWSVNEKVAFEVALAASICGARALSAMKHVGVNVAHDPVMIAGYMGAKGGLVLVSGDDPGQWSSQNEQDNRYIAEQGYIPVLEPSSAQEAKDMTRDAFLLSEKYNQPFMLRTVTRISHARGDVKLGAIPETRNKVSFEKDPQKLIFMPALTRKMRHLMIERLAAIKQAVNDLPYNKLTLCEGAQLGLIASGIAYSYAKEAIQLLGLENKVSLLKIGTPYPLPEILIQNLLESTPVLLIAEELEPIIETHVKALAQEKEIKTVIHGKNILPLEGELSTRILVEALVSLTGCKLPTDFSRIDALVKEVAPLLPIKPPTLCAGCPHRASLLEINMACQRIKDRTGIDPIRSGDIGCYGMGSNAPLRTNDIATCMGGGYGIANGLAHVVDNAVIGYCGDSTFFASGMPALVNAVYNNANITMVVLDNSTTAMTGSQPNPVVGYNGMGDVAPFIRPEDIAKAAGVPFVEMLDPQDFSMAVDILEKAISTDGPSLVVLKRTCSILDQREKRRRGEKIVPYQVNQDKCVANSDPPCTATCPLHIDVRGYVGLISEGKYDDALQLIKQTLPFPAIMGRICTHPCESQCTRGEVDDSVAIAALKRSAADFGHADDDLSIGTERQETVAIVGGGPAGVMAAYDLRKRGYRVTIFEASSRLGGMLADAIPDHRLPKDIVEKEFDIVRKLGVEIRYNTKIGDTVPFSYLKDNFDAIFLAVGAQSPVNMDIQGTGSKGFYDGLNFLKAFNNGKKEIPGKKVAVIGGGNVAIDVARTLLRVGSEPEIIYRRSRDEMPALEEEVFTTEEEGVKINYLTQPVEAAENGNGIALTCVKMELGEPDESGRRRPIPIKGSDYTANFDAVMTAIGQSPDLSFIEGNSIGHNGLITADAVTFATSAPGIFAGGDAVTGPASVVEALSAGRRAATSIDRYLRGDPMDTGREGEGTQCSKLKMSTTGVEKQPRQALPSLPVEQRKGNMEEVIRGYSSDDAAKEGKRCLSCSCRICINTLGCPALFINENNEVTIDPSQCPGCGLCAWICPQEAISLQRSE